MTRYIVTICVVLFSCGEAEFGMHQDEDAGSAEGVDVIAESWARAAAGSGGEGSFAAGKMNAMGELVEFFHVGVVDRALDILIVIDNSTTMNIPNTELSEKIAPLISKISASDWQIAITTSTITDCLRGLLIKGKDDLAKFKEIVSKVHSKYLSQTDRASSNNEQVVKMATRALQGMPLAKNAGQNVDIDCSGNKEHWVRANSMLVVLLISDEDAHDSTHQPENRCDNLSCVDAFYNHLSSIRVPHVSAKIYGILDGRANHADSSHPSFNRNILYLQWRDAQTGLPLFDYHHTLYYGKTNVLNNFNVMLRKISANISQALQNVFVLANSYHTNNISVTRINNDTSTEELPPDTYTLTDHTLVIDPDQLYEAAKIKVQPQH